MKIDFGEIKNLDDMDKYPPGTEFVLNDDMYFAPPTIEQADSEKQKDD
jgi:hypothetical protein